MIIPFTLEKNPYNENDKPIYLGNQTRYSSLTSVAFINENTLVCCSYYNRKMYIIEFNFDTGDYVILDSIYTFTKRNTPTISDLIDYNHNLIVTSNLMNCSLSFFSISKDNLLKYEKTIINSIYGLCHGVKFHPINKDIIYFSTSGRNNPNCGIYGIYLNKGDNQKPFLSVTENNWPAKDLCFSKDGKLMFAIFSEGCPSNTNTKIYSSKVILYKMPFFNKAFKLSEILLKDCHLDCIKMFDEKKLWITIQEHNSSGFIYEIGINEENQLYFSKKIGDYSFPHGLDIKDNLYTITEYGTNTLSIFSKKEDVSLI